jgi:hypothetical protein
VTVVVVVATLAAIVSAALSVVGALRDDGSAGVALAANALLWALIAAGAVIIERWW